MKKQLLIVLGILVCLIIVSFAILFIVLLNNKTFFKTTYIGVDNQEIFIPKYSYFKEECCMTAATFISLKSKYTLDKEIDNYLSGFHFYENDETYGYEKGDLFIQSYIVEEKGLYRKIIITY